MLGDGTDLYQDPRLYQLEHGGQRSDLAFYLAVAARARPQTVLELGCGTGRVTLELARAGYLVTALDAEPAMLEWLRHDLLELPRTIVDRVRIRTGDARTFRDDERSFGSVIAPFNLLQHLDEAGLTDLLHNARAQLAESGRFACDLFAPLATDARVDDADFTGAERHPLPRNGGTLLVDRRERYDRSERLLTTTIRCQALRPDGTLAGSELRRLCRRQWTHDQLSQALAAADFAIEACHGDVDLTPYHPAAPRMMFIARRG